jgi:hypothetical protein
MVNSYLLVNPHIEGKFDSKIKARNSKEAANIFYKNLSEHFNNSIPKFHFSIQKGSSGDGKFYHFQVQENRENNEVNFKISPLEIKGEEQLMPKFLTKLDNFKSKLNQDGGKKSKKHSKRRKHKKDVSDSESSESSDSDFYTRARSYLPTTQPIYYWWYDPSLYRLDSIYIPTFYSYVTPYIELSLL